MPISLEAIPAVNQGIQLQLWLCIPCAQDHHFPTYFIIHNYLFKMILLVQWNLLGHLGSASSRTRFWGSRGSALPLGQMKQCDTPYVFKSFKSCLCYNLNRENKLQFYRHRASWGHRIYSSLSFNIKIWCHNVNATIIIMLMILWWRQ